MKKRKITSLLLPIVAFAMVLGTSGLKETAQAMFADETVTHYIPCNSVANLSDSQVASRIKNTQYSNVRFPNFTFLIPGLGSNEGVWSNSLEFTPGDSDSGDNYYLSGSAGFYYDEDSVVAKIEKETNTSIYVAKCGNEEGSVYEIHHYVKEFDDDNNPYYDYKGQVKNIVSSNTDGNHSVVVYHSNNSGQAFETEYNNFERIVNRLCLDFKVTYGFTPKINLIGHSRGGLIAQEYANNYPHNVYSVNAVASPFFGSENGRLVERLSKYLIIGTAIRYLASGFLGMQGYIDLQNKNNSNSQRNGWNQARSVSNIKATAYGSCLTLPFISRLLSLTIDSGQNEAAEFLYASILNVLAQAFEAINTSCTVNFAPRKFNNLITFENFDSCCVPVGPLAVEPLKAALRIIRDTIFTLGASGFALLQPLLSLIPAPIMPIVALAALALFVETEFAITDLANTLAKNIYCYNGQVCILRDDFLVALDSQLCPGYMNYTRLVKVFDIDYLSVNSSFNASEEAVLVGHNLETLNRTITQSIVDRGRFATYQEVADDITWNSPSQKAEKTGSVNYYLNADDFVEFNGHGHHWGEFHGFVPIAGIPGIDYNSVFVTGFDNYSDGEFFDDANAGFDNGINVILYVHEDSFEATGYITIYFTYESDSILSNIQITPPAKTTYIKGEELDTTGLTVTAYYTLGESRIVTDFGYTCDDDVMEQVGNHTVTVFYTENVRYGNVVLPLTKTASFNITVREPELEEIQVALDNCQTTFTRGGVFDYTGLEVFARYENNHIELVEEGYIVNSSEVDMDMPGEYTVYVTYTVGQVTKSANYTVSVINAPLDYIELDGNYQTSFLVGDAFNYDNLEVYAHYENAFYSRVYEFNVDYSDIDMTQAGVYTVYISYTENDVTRTADYQVVVEEPVSLVSISLSGDYQTAFRRGTTFNSDGLIVTAHYCDGTSAEVSNFIVDYSDVDMNRRGFYEVYVSYTEDGETVTTSYTIFVLSDAPVLKTLESITLSGNYRTSFRKGQAFTYSGLIVTAHYDNGTSTVVTNYVVDTSRVDFDTEGFYDVYVFYQERGVIVSASYTILIGKLVHEPIFPKDPIKPIPGKF